MKRLHLFEAVGLVDERLVEEAADAKRTAQPWHKWLAAAACAALALSLGTAAAGTLLRGCGSVNSSAEKQASESATADMAAPADSAPAPAAAPAAEAVSEESSEMERYEDKQGGTEQQAAAAVPETAAGLETIQAEPEEPLPEPAAAPSDLGGMSNDSMGALQKVPELYDAAGETVITLRATVEDEEAGIRRALYLVENQSSVERTEILHYTLCTGDEGLEGLDLEIRVDGETVPFDAYEATVCPTVYGTVPELEERSYLIEFSAALPAKKRIEVEIQY